MIKLFGVSETASSLLTNGDHVLRPSKAIVHKYENGDYYLELETILDDASWFENNKIIVVDDMPNGVAEYFRIKNLVFERGKVKCTCPQIADDLKFKVQPFDGSANRDEATSWYTLLGFMNGYNGGFVGGNAPLTVSNYSISGETDFDSFYASTTEWEGMTFWEVMQAYMKKFGGFLYRSKLGFGIRKSRITTDRGFTIRYGSNLKNISKSEDWSDVCTYMVAVGSTGLKKSYTSSTSYTYQYNKVVKFQQDLNASDYNTQSAYDDAIEADLDAKASAYLAEHSTPAINYTLDAYVGNSNGWEVQDVGDVINVIDENLNINIMTTVLGFDFDVIGQKFNKIEFGNFANSMKGYNTKVNERLVTLEDNLTSYTYPVGAIIQNNGGNPATQGINGYWTQLSSSGGVYSWKRVS